MIRPVIRLIKALQSNTSPVEVASGAVLSLYIGLTPLNGTHQVFLFLLFFFLKINRAATVLLLPLVKLFYVLGLAYVADRIGYYLLTEPAFLRPFWSWATHAPVAAYLNLNHTLVLGGFVIALVLSLPLYMGVCKLIESYRESVAKRTQQWKIVRWLQGLGIVKWFSSWWPGGE